MSQNLFNSFHGGSLSSLQPKAMRLGLLFPLWTNGQTEMTVGPRGPSVADSAIEMALGDGVSAAACRPALIVTGAQPSGHLQSLHLYPLAPSDGTSFGSRQDPTSGSLQTEENGPCVSEGLRGPSTPGHSNWNDEVPPPRLCCQLGCPHWLCFKIFQRCGVEGP